MILSDRDITARLDDPDDGLSIDPLDDPEQQIQPASIDLRLGNEFIEPATETLVSPVTEPDAGERVVIEDRTAYVLPPGGFVLGTTAERIAIPDDLLGQVHGRSSVGRVGIQIHITAGLIDPGFYGDITLELSNVSDSPVALPPGMRIAQLVLKQLTSESERPYGVERGSKYQDQNGPQVSRLAADEDYVTSE